VGTGINTRVHFKIHSQ